MSFRHIDRLEARGRKERLWPGVNALPVLHRAGGMIGDPPFGSARGRCRRGEPEGLNHLGDLAGGGPYSRRLLGVNSIFAQHKAVILYGRAAARSVDYDGIKPEGEALALPRLDVGACEPERRRLPAEMIGKGSATAAAARDHDFATVACQQTDRGPADFRR